MLSFCYHKRLSGHSPGNRFSILFVILFYSFTYFRATEKPVEPKFYGYLTFGHNVPYGTLYLDIFAVHAFDFAALHLSRGVRPISPSSNILLRVNSHRIFSLSLHCSLLIEYYSMIVATRPDPTVRPPSRIANVRPWLIAIGWISSIVISMLSPGMHISVPSGRLQTPVTSVVLK